MSERTRSPSHRSGLSTRRRCAGRGSTASGLTCTQAGHGRGLPRVSSETGKGSAVWKGGYAAPQSAAWHSSLSPVLASLDLFNANYLTAQEVTTDLHLINDSWHDAQVHVDLLLTRECPEFIPEATCFDSPVSKWSFDFVAEVGLHRQGSGHLEAAG